MMLCQQHGHEVVALANLLPAEAGVDELDSHMFQTVGHQVIDLYAACMGVPLLRRRIQGASVQQVTGQGPAQCLVACLEHITTRSSSHVLPDQLARLAVQSSVGMRQRTFAIGFACWSAFCDAPTPAAVSKEQT